MQDAVRQKQETSATGTAAEQVLCWNLENCLVELVRTLGAPQRDGNNVIEVDTINFDGRYFISKVRCKTAYNNEERLHALKNGYHPDLQIYNLATDSWSPVHALGKRRTDIILSRLSAVAVRLKIETFQCQ